ncbi:17527_t:CDS:1, partial [Acaulospora colombiana]
TASEGSSRMAVFIEICNILAQNGAERELTETPGKVRSGAHKHGQLDVDTDGSADGNEEEPKGRAITLNSKLMTSGLESLHSMA